MLLDALPPSREFSVGRCEITFPLLKCRQIRNARRIYLNSAYGPEFKDFLAKLPQLEKLEDLFLTSLELSEDDINSLARAKQLKCLSLDKTELSPAQLAKLMSLPELKALSVRGCLFSPKEILQALETCPNRRRLKLAITLPNLSTKNIEKLRALEHKIDEPTFNWTKTDMATIRSKVLELELIERESIKRYGGKGYVPFSAL